MNKQTSFVLQFAVFILLWSLFYPQGALAHGVEGQRFFPESISVLDPFPADEADLLAFSHRKDNESLTDTFGAGISKRLTPNLSIGIDGAYDRMRPNDGSTKMWGFENFALDMKYSMLKVPEHEFIAATALKWEIGGTGARGVGSDQHSSVTPQFLFGYGLGDLPDSLGYLKPLAVTGQLGLTAVIGNRSADAADIADTLSYGLVVEYSLLYMQSFVKDVGIKWPFNRLFPVVEFNFQTVLNGPNAGRTIALANPGLIWAGRYYEIGVEAAVPLNNRTGHNVGVQALIHLFLDDIFPDTYGRPFFGNSEPLKPGTSNTAEASVF